MMTLQRSDYYTSEDLTPELLASAQARLGVKLPHDYIDDLYQCNGGTPPRPFFETSFPTSWAPEGFEVSGVLGLGGDRGIDGEEGGAYALAREWGYPSGCVAFCDTPAAGPDTVLFDYRDCGPDGEPTIVYFDADGDDPGPHQIAESYTSFLDQLVDNPA